MCLPGSSDAGEEIHPTAKRVRGGRIEKLQEVEHGVHEPVRIPEHSAVSVEDLLASPWIPRGNRCKALPLLPVRKVEHRVEGVARRLRPFDQRSQRVRLGGKGRKRQESV